MAERLAHESSQYLRSAAGSPVDWWPWGAEAFEQARREDKPILLDIGAVWCHWCHVMDHGTYEDAEVVRRLAEDFVCIKVDRDERPDVDVRYQRAVGAITGQGGWPLTAFLTSEGKVFYGGTYFPAEDAQGRPGFRNVLQQIAHVYAHDRARVEDSASHIMDAIRRSTERPAAAVALDAGVLEQAGKALVQAHDHKFGGFGSAPKFPHTPAIQLAMVLGARSGDEQLAKVAYRSLDKMAAGGIHDRVMGGFHRYSVDAHWTVPHFEKMAYDNAELLRTYAEAYARTGEASYRSVADGIVRWVLDECADREHGGFAASQDADLGPHDDGDHFTWTLDELRAALEGPVTADGLDPDALWRIARARFGVEERGDMHHDPAKNVLEVEMAWPDVATSLGLPPERVEASEGVILERLRAARRARERPFIDPTRFTDWNAMFCVAFLEAGVYLGDEEATRHALRTLDRLVAEHWDDERGWLHRPRDDGGLEVAGLLDDHVWMGHALLAAYVLAGRNDLLVHAEGTAERLMRDFAAADGGFFDIAASVREKAVAAPLQEADRPWLDQSGPGSNPLAARFLLRMGRLRERSEWVDAAERTLAAFAGEASRMGVFAASWALGVAEWSDDPPLVTVLGAADDAATVALLQVARSTPRPGRLVLHVEPGVPEAAPSYLREFVGNEDLVKDGPRALVCHGDRCDALTGDVDDLRDRLLARGR